MIWLQFSTPRQVNCRETAASGQQLPHHCTTLLYLRAVYRTKKLFPGPGLGTPVKHMQEINEELRLSLIERKVKRRSSDLGVCQQTHSAQWIS